jgi:hypothetical protein
MAVVSVGYEKVVEEPLENLRDEIEPREVELKKTRVDTTDGDRE